MTADKTRLKQVILNLLSNAVKYNRDQGTVTLECVATRNERVRLQFTDTGRGIPAEQLENLFQPFNRMGAERTGIEGTGIGLTLSKQLIECMGGAIGAQSTLNQGSCFWIDIPWDSQPHSLNSSDSEPQNTLPDAPEGMTKTVLYVDDNPSNIKLIRGLISHHSRIRLLDAHTPDLGLELARQHHPDLIILDINMPGLDGYEVLSILKRTPAFVETPIIALTANAMTKDIEKGLNAGFAHYLTKPLNVPAFFEVIETILGLDKEKEHGPV
ncbi:ATP-binding protein [Marinobacterium sediminicola]|uniref:ATP-binding protein n=1 Tax=Marinobacterium sediminicola TaxID=518898 RepID=UPI0024B743B9|nr:ATP-binding protein [Marinobacterium sediminicola]